MQREEQEQRAKDGKGLSHSILFPLFGTGTGGSSVSDVVQAMILGITGFLDDPHNHSSAKQLSDIYLSAYFKKDVDIVIQKLDEILK